MPRTPLFDPDAFFRERGGGLPAPALIVLWFGAATVGRDLPSALRGGPDASAAVLAAAVALGAAVVGGTAWLLAAAAVHLVSALYGGDGGFGRTLAYVGWGFLPGALVGLLAAAAAVAVAAPPRWWAGAGALAGAGTALWQGYVWAYAAAYARSVGRAAGFATAAVPVSGGLALIAFGLLG